MNPTFEKRLLKCGSISEFLTMFFGLSQKEKLSVLGDDYTIAKGTKLYRIRKDDNRTDFGNPEEWFLPPVDLVKQGRFNKSNSPMLYVASDFFWLEREVSLQKGDVYYLATYICEADFSVGTLLNGNNDIRGILHNVAKAIEKIDCLNEEELFYLNQCEVDKLTPKDCILNIQSPYLIHKFVKNVYCQTNRIGELVLRKNVNGIRYGSAFEPIETIGKNHIFTLDGIQRANFALTSEGIKNIRFLSAEKKKCTFEYSLEIFFKTMNEMRDEND